MLRGAPQALFPGLLRAWGATHLVYERDTDAYARGRDAAVAKLAAAAGVEVVTRSGRTLWDSDELVARHHGGKPTMSITQLQAAGRAVGPIPRPLPAPEGLPDPGDTPLDFDLELDLAQAPNSDAANDEVDVNAAHRTEGADTSHAHLAGPGGDFGVPTLAELGFAAGAATTPHRGGETRVLARLDEVVTRDDEAYAATFRKPRTSPAAFDPPATTLLSPALHFGALSPRLFYWRAQDAVDSYEKKRKEQGKGREEEASKPPESLTGQLLFRDMYFAAQAGIGEAFTRTLGNPHCRFIPWHLPSKTGGAADGAYEVDSAEAERWFRRWRAGTTGFPFADALMRQLRREGWIHHLGRHVLACLLTRGGCYVDWERGADVFAELLLDHEPACNAGNWQWLACAAFFAQYHRVYSPVAFGRRWDPDGRLIRRYVPELARLDAKYIYEPWKAPRAALDDAGVRIEGDGLEDEDQPATSREGTYPPPMFDFAERRRACMAAMKTAYAVGLYGDDKRVRDGSWRRLFEQEGSGKTEMRGESDGHEDEDQGTTDDGEHADDADHQPQRKKHGRSGSGSAKEGPMDKHVKKLKT